MKDHLRLCACCRDSHIFFYQVLSKFPCSPYNHLQINVTSSIIPSRSSKLPSASNLFFIKLAASQQHSCLKNSKTLKSRSWPNHGFQVSNHSTAGLLHWHRFTNPNLTHCLHDPDGFCIKPSWIWKSSCKRVNSHLRSVTCIITWPCWQSFGAPVKIACLGSASFWSPSKQINHKNARKYY